MPMTVPEAVNVCVPLQHEELLSKVRNSTRTILSFDIKTRTLRAFEWYVVVFSFAM
jgi:hypothetical protein